MSRNQNFWTGFGVGAAAGAVAILLPQILGRAGASRIIRLEKSVQIGRPVEEVFEAWTDWDRLPRVSDHIANIRNFGNRSHWRVNLGGRIVEWHALTEQFIQNQAIGWKSINGPKHTGRITFSPLGDNTIVHVTMNYAPPSRVMRPFMSSMTGHMEGLIEKVLRQFKASVESRPAGVQNAVRTGISQPGPGTSMTDLPRTGTFGDEPQKIESRFGGSVHPAGYPNSPDVKR
ncbi:MAG TPA: SRPBCC family protein [Terriglobales bacterium]|nr:SRPBCC family protein [Terriglobales bacterium]